MKSKESLKGTKCLVTGGAGFIGTNLSETLVKQGSQVSVIDDLSTGKKANLTYLESLGVTSFVGSILDVNILSNAMKDIDYVFHQAAFVSVPRSIKEPSLCNEINISGTLNVLNASVKSGVQKFIYAASSSVYGETPVLPKTESMTPSPLSPYAVSKLTAENYCKVYNDVYGLSTTSLRYFNIYGPWQDPNSRYAAVVPNFFTSVLCGESPAIYGDGKQSRNFTFVSDTVQANIKAALSPQADGKIINISSGERTTVNELALGIIELIGANVKPKYCPPRMGEIQHSHADINLAKELLDFAPQYDLRKGLKETLSYYNKN